MGLSAVLIDVNGQERRRLDDGHNFLHSLLPPADETSLSILSKIDWYGETSFNYLQMGRFLQEWEGLRLRACNSEQIALVEGIREFAMQCQTERYILRFIGG